MLFGSSDEIACSRGDGGWLRTLEDLLARRGTVGRNTVQLYGTVRLAGADAECRLACRSLDVSGPLEIGENVFWLEAKYDDRLHTVVF